MTRNVYRVTFNERVLSRSLLYIIELIEASPVAYTLSLFLLEHQVFCILNSDCYACRVLSTYIESIGITSLNFRIPESNTQNTGM